MAISLDSEDYEDMTNMQNQNKEALENETYSTIIPLTSGSVQEAALDGENTQLPFPAPPTTSDPHAPSSIPQSSSSADTTVDTANKHPSSDKKG